MLIHRLFINNQAMNIYCLFWECSLQAIMTVNSESSQGGQQQSVSKTPICPHIQNSFLSHYLNLLFLMETVTMLKGMLENL
jgi:hypothetical protein